MDILKLSLKLIIKIIGVVFCVIILTGLLVISSRDGFFEGIVLSLFGLGSTALFLVSAYLLFVFFIDLFCNEYKNAFLKLAVILISLSIYFLVFLYVIPDFF